MVSGGRLRNCLPWYTRLNCLGYLPHCIFVQVILEIIEKFDDSSALLEWICTTVNVERERESMLETTDLIHHFKSRKIALTISWSVSYLQQCYAVANVSKSWWHPNSNSLDCQCERMLNLAKPNHCKTKKKIMNFRHIQNLWAKYGLTCMGCTVGWFRPTLADKLESWNCCQSMHSILSDLQLLFYAIPICRIWEKENILE